MIASPTLSDRRSCLSIPILSPNNARHAARLPSRGVAIGIVVALTSDLERISITASRRHLHLAGVTAISSTGNTTTAEVATHSSTSEDTERGCRVLLRLIALQATTATAIGTSDLWLLRLHNRVVDKLLILVNATGVRIVRVLDTDKLVTICQQFVDTSFKIILVLLQSSLAL